MKRTAIFAAAALSCGAAFPVLAASTGSGAQIAPQPTQKMMRGKQATPPAGGVKTDTDTQAKGDMNASKRFEDVLAAIKANAQTAHLLETAKAISRVKIVQASALNGADMDKLHRAVSDRMGGVNELRSALRGNKMLNSKLSGRSVDPSKVVAATIENDGSVTVFLD